MSNKEDTKPWEKQFEKEKKTLIQNFTDKLNKQNNS